MKIKSLIRRENGHVVELDGKSYSFNPKKNYVCNVKEITHQAVFLGIPEGYEPADPKEKISSNVIALIPEKNLAEARSPTKDPVKGSDSAINDGEDDDDAEFTEEELADLEKANDLEKKAKLDDAENNEEGSDSAINDGETTQETKEDAKAEAPVEKEKPKAKSTPRKRN